MTNNTVERDKNRILKSLAIAGFIGLIIVIAWLGIKLVQVLPNAFGSLASLADSVYNYEPPTVTASSNKTTAAVDETVTLTWEGPKTAGSYAFSYQCAEGLALDMRASDGAVKSLMCDTNYSIGDVTSLEVVAMAEKTRFTDLKYRIDYIPSGKTEPTASDENTIVVLNATIGSTPTETATSTPATSTPPVAVATTTPTKPTTPVKPTTPTKPASTTYVQTPVYGIPTSDPKGYTDLAVTIIGAGTLEGRTFTRVTKLDNDKNGAVQFSIHNLGTKTSDRFTYEVKLPNGETFTSGVQSPLKPNERAVLTLGFLPEDVTGTKSYSVRVTTASDKVSSNNTANAKIEITQ